MTDRKIEILAPAGSYECFRAAVNAGADAVYAAGQRFGARAYADNFTEEELIRAIGEAHLLGKKFYLTVNTLLKDAEIEELYDYLAPLYENGLDAVIVQDAGVMEYVKSCFPEMDIHVSTQMTVTGAYGARFLESRGASRVVPARELSIKEIRQIHDETSLEVECFVHGALCYCYSGQCLLSSMIGGRSGNRGQCAQPCRLPYTINGEKKYFLSPKDICTLEQIPDLVEAGINSFKIEGRMKKPEYVAGVTSMYRRYVDLYLNEGRKRFHVSEKDKEALMDLYNRGGFSEGYYRQHNGREMMALERPNHAGVPALECMGQKGRELKCRALTDLNKGDVIEIGGGKDNYTIGTPLSMGDSFAFLVRKGVKFPKGKVFCRIRNEQLVQTIRDRFLSSDIKTEICGFLRLADAEPAVLTVWQGDTVYTVCSEVCAQTARSHPLRAEDIEARLRKTGNTEFVFSDLEIQTEGDIFFPMQQLNSMRREALEGLKSALLARASRKPGKRPKQRQQSKREESREPLVTALAETKEQLRVLCTWVEDGHPLKLETVYLDAGIAEHIFGDAFICEMTERLRAAGTKVVPALPHIFRGPAVRQFEANGYRQMISGAEDGILIRNYEEYQFLREHGFDKTVILDHNLYVFNRFAREFWKKENVYRYTIPAELNSAEMGQMDLEEAELILYGRLPVMVSAQCLLRTAKECTGKETATILRDRMGSEFPVRNFCRYCYNVIYNTDPLYLGRYMDEIRNLSPRSIRLQFSVEKERETREVLEMVQRDLYPGEYSEETNFLMTEKRTGQTGSFTQGHFKREVI